jgi:hypothetical protein
MAQLEQLINNMPRALYIALRTEEIRAEGRRNAFIFVQEAEGNPAAIQKEIAWYDRVFADPSMTVQGQPFAPDTSVRRHADGFVIGLRDALQMVSLSDKSIAWHKEEVKTEGRRDAFEFALKCQGDVVQIKAEIAKSETALAELSNANEHLHAEGYLSGLRDALKILQANQPNGH